MWVPCAHCCPQHAERCLHVQGAQYPSSTDYGRPVWPSTSPALSVIASLRLRHIACVWPDRGHQRSVPTAGHAAGGIPHCINIAPRRHQSVGGSYSEHGDILRVIQRPPPGPPRQRQGTSAPGTSTRRALKLLNSSSCNWGLMCSKRLMKRRFQAREAAEANPKLGLIKQTPHIPPSMRGERERDVYLLFIEHTHKHTRFSVFF